MACSMVSSSGGASLFRRGSRCLCPLKSAGRSGIILGKNEWLALQNDHHLRHAFATVVISTQKRYCSSSSSSSNSNSSSKEEERSIDPSISSSSKKLKTKVPELLLDESFFNWKNKEIWTVPNIITMSRIVSSPILAITIAYDMKIVSFAGCVFFAFSDWLDGYIAKNYNQATVLGAFLDPVADKCLITALTLGLAAKGLLPIAVACTFIGRDVALIGLSTYVRWREKPPDAPFFNTTHSATFEIVPSELSKLNTFLQLVLLTSTMSHFSFGAPSLLHVEPLYWISAVTTVASGVSYLDGSGIRRLSETGVGRGHEKRG